MRDRHDPTPVAAWIGGGRPSAPDRILAVASWTTAALVCAAFGWIVLDLARRGLPELSLSFLIEPVQDAGRAGGVGPILLSTALILLVCLGASVPIAVAAAIMLSGFTRRPGRLGHLVRLSLDVLAGVPSIVFGLFGNAVFCIGLGMGFSILSGGLTLACMALPIMVRTMEAALRSTPASYRTAGAALGLSHGAVLRRIVLPAAAPGLAVGLILGVGRALAETAALMFTSGYVARTPGSLLDSGRALSLHIYDLSMNVPGGEARAAASALLLTGLVLLANVITRWAADGWLRRRLTES